MDVDGYPTEEELEIIRKWDFQDFMGLIDYIYDMWEYADCGYFDEKDGIYNISTAGWSGNESIIYAMMENYMWWHLHWLQSKRGGHYQFKDCKFIPEEKSASKSDIPHSK